MSRPQRVGILLAALAIAFVAFVALRPGDDDPASTTSTTPPAEQQATTPAGQTTAEPRPKPRPRPRAVEIVARGLQPVGGVTEVTVRKGETIRLIVRSDQTDEAHLHGYDVSKEVGPGMVARFAVPANLEGIFELELEHAGVPIAEIKVEP